MLHQVEFSAIGFPSYIQSFNFLKSNYAINVLRKIDMSNQSTVQNKFPIIKILISLKWNRKLNCNMWNKFNMSTKAGEIHVRSLVIHTEEITATLS